jgi:hypothetical protein
MAKITKEQMIELRKDIDAALLAVAEKHGLKSLKAMKGKYDPNFGSFSFNLEGVTADGLDEHATRYTLLYERYEWPTLFSEFEHDRKPFKITGCNKTRTKIYCQNGEKTYEFPPELVKTIFQLKELKSKVSGK